MIFKRFLAYIIDLFLVFLIVSLFAKIEIINPNAKEYNLAVQQLNELTREYTQMIANNSSGIEEIAYQMNELSYEISKYSVATNIINILVVILYFVIFQYLNNGQTIGKKILGIKIVNNKEDKLSILQLTIRAIILYGILTQTTLILLLLLSTKEMYINLYSYITVIESLLLLITFAFMLFREDKKGLHDLIAGTNVIKVERRKL